MEHATEGSVLVVDDTEPNIDALTLAVDILKGPGRGGNRSVAGAAAGRVRRWS